jgi:hypothetical protein
VKENMKYNRDKISDSMITVQLCHHLIRLNIAFDVEYTIRFPRITNNISLTDHGYKLKKKIRRKRGSRFDVVIVYVDKIVGIVETKGTKQKAKNQVKQYQEFGVPVHLCCGYEGIDEAIKFAEKCINDYKISILY